MHQPKPHGTFGAANEEDAAAAELLARRLTNFKSVSGLDSLKMARTLPSGAMAIAVDMGGVLRVIIQPPLVPERATIESDGTAKNYIPMLFSGCVTKAVVAPGAGVEIKLSQTARRRLVSYDPEAALAPASVTLQRFVIEHHQRVAELMPKQQSAYTWTQYANQRPTWYSGGMAEVMQVVGGYGRQVLRELPDTKIERARLLLPPKYAKKVDEQLGNTRLPGYLGLPMGNGQFQYDYKFNETHGVAFDSASKPWLVRVNTRGVHVMPLPLIPATTTKAFRECMESVNDGEILWILDRFGGMPSGESFPTDPKDFESWRRAGCIVKVCDAAGFYDHQAYTSAIGWSFNSSGTEGFNTCYDYDDQGIGYGLSFKLQLRLGAATNQGKLPVAFDLSDRPEDMALLNGYLSMLYGRLPGNTARERAIKYKLRRVPIGDLLGRASQYSRFPSDGAASAEVDHWDNLEAAPIATHGGNITETARGKLWHGSPPRGQPQIKFPEPFMGGCISHDFGRLEGFPRPTGVKCDTAMFGYYVGDSLKTVKYFYDERTYQNDVEDNYDDCMIVGAWERTATTGSTSLMGNFYTSDVDEREAAAPITTVTKTVGTDLGYDTKPHFAFDHFFSMVGTMWRNRYFQHKVNETKTEGYSKSVAVCIPYFGRNAMLHAMRESSTSASANESLSVYSISDPNSYRYYTYDFVWAWVGGSSEGETATGSYGSPAPKDGSPVYVRGYTYGPYPCSDFADNGDWVGGLPADYTWLIHPVRHEWHHSGGGGPPTVKTYNRPTPATSKNAGELVISMLPQVETVNKEPSPRYFMSSPNEFGDVFYVDAIENKAGSAVYANTSEEDPESPKQRKRWGFTELADHKSAHHFIGVING